MLQQEKNEGKKTQSRTVQIIGNKHPKNALSSARSNKERQAKFKGNIKPPLE
jgi:hypothetical protein